MCWSNTPPKEKKEGDEEEEEIGEPEEGEEEEEPEPPQLDENGEEIPKKVYVSYKEKDYERRKPIEKYEKFKSLETLCLSAQNSKPNFLGYVLCSGVLYGNGEEVFADYFKQAWLQNPDALSYIGDGKNVIPTIHVKDLAMFVSFVVNKKPPTKYIFAIDHSRKPTLKNHVETISKGLGTGKVRSIPVEQAAGDPNLDVFKLNIKLQPSKAMETGEGEEEEEQEEEPAEGEEGEENAEKVKIPKFKFVWYCKEGIKKNIAKIVEEYNTFRGLKPIKIFITGPPASGKSFFGAQLSKHYNIPRILVADVIKEAAELQTEFGEEFRTALEDAKNQMIEKLEAELAEQGKETEGAIDPEKIFPRLLDEFLIKAYKYRLEKNDCFNRGFVLDGFPKTYDQAKGTFLTTAPPKEGEDEDPDNPKLIIDERKVPEFVIKLEATDDFLEKRVKNLPEEEVEGTHYNEEGMDRRLKEYRNSNVSEGGSSVLSTFFDENGIEILRLDCGKLNNKELFNAMRVFIERKEKFKNYQNFEEEEETKRIRDLKQKQEEEKKEKEIITAERDAKEAEQTALQAEIARLMFIENKQKENKLLNERSLPLRQYLADQISPILTQGIIEICKKDPKDPVDFLAEYLFSKSLSVKQPDPGSPAKE